jgi:hypothetical protein
MMRISSTRRLALCGLAAVLFAASAAVAQRQTPAALRAGEPLKAGTLTIFPVHTSKPKPPVEYLTLNEALETGALIVSEVGEGTVNTVIVTNKGSRPIYIMAGQIIIGGKQDRTITDDVIILPRSKAKRIAVHCVERGRWHGKTQAFQAAPGVLNLKARSASQVERSQSAVWENVASANAALGTETETGTYRAVLEAPAVRKRIEQTTQTLVRELPRGDDVIGCVVAVGGKIVGADVFADAGLFRKLWPQLLQSYATEAASARDAGGQRPTTAQAQVFLQRGASGRARTVSRGKGALVTQRDAEDVVVIETQAEPAAAPMHQSFFAK